MNKPWIVMTAAAGFLLALAGVGFAATGGSAPQVGALLEARQEVPKPKAAAGAGLFTANLRGSKLTWRMTFTKLTGPANGGAHIHIAPRGKANPKPAVALCGPCRAGQRGTATVTAAVVKAIRSGRAYVNVHIEKNPAGEIRGQLAIVG